MSKIILLNEPGSSGIMISIELANKIISIQFPQYAHFSLREVEQQGHDNRTYRIGDDMLIRMPTRESYAIKVPKEQDILPKLAKHLNVTIPEPIKVGKASVDYPYPFSIYKWIEGRSANLVQLDGSAIENIALELANFLRKLQGITNLEGPPPGQHNFWRGDHVSVYDEGARKQIASLSYIIDSHTALDLWEKACATKWHKKPVWIHGDFAAGNILIKNNKLSGVIDFGGTAMGDPACDLAIGWTYLSDKARDIFIREISLDRDTLLRARAWVLWKATFELCQMKGKDSIGIKVQKDIIDSVLSKEI